MKKLRLTIELVPASCWFSNVRSAVTRTQWDHIRHSVYSQAYHVCEICGGTGRKHPVECHEIWDYDDKNLVQKLKNMIALCPNCHMVKHIGFAQIQNKEIDAIKHLKKVNDLTTKEAETYIQEVFQIWSERSKKNWKLDVSSLKTYGIDVNTIKQRK